YQWIPGESAPRFQLRSNAFFVTGNGDQFARPAAAQHSDQLPQEARRERLPPDVQIDLSLHRNRCSLRVDPSVRAPQLDSHIRKGKVQGSSIRRTAVLRRDQEWAGMLVAFPRCDDKVRPLGSPVLEKQLLDAVIFV